MKEDEAMGFHTDLNERERQRYAEICRSISTAANDLAKALGSGDDTKMLIEFAVFSVMVSPLSELQKIVLASARRSAKEVKSTEFLPPDKASSLL